MVGSPLEMLNQPHSGFHRIPYAQRCRVTRGGVGTEAHLCNVSVLGVYLTLDPIPAVGEKLHVSFTLPGGGDPVEASGPVTWQNLDEDADRVQMLPPGCGISFEDLKPADRERIERLVVEHRAGLPLGIGAAPPRSGFVRVPYLQRCQIMVGGRPRVAIVCNVSALGAYVALDELPEMGALVTVSFMLPRDARRFVSAAVVAWRNPGEDPKVDRIPPGVGLRFIDLLSEERARVEKLVLQYEYCATLSSDTTTS
jgi:hypothetical protein